MGNGFNNPTIVRLVETRPASIPRTFTLRVASDPNSGQVWSTSREWRAEATPGFQPRRRGNGRNTTTTTTEFPSLFDQPFDQSFDQPIGQPLPAFGSGFSTFEPLITGTQAAPTNTPTEAVVTEATTIALRRRPVRNRAATQTNP